ncbi:MAG: vWA domain-containing protein, partial [Chloroflexota bacterium]
MSIIRRFLYKAAADQMRLPGRRSHPRRSCTGRLFGCLLIVILSLLVCGLLALAIKQVQAASPALAVYLLVDNSNSTFDKTDPLFLRIAAVRLIITYLSLDEGQTTHQCGVIFFGSQAEVVVPLTSLQGQAQLPDLFDQIANPPRLGWTDHAAALRLARQQFEVESPAARRIIILLTDGKPEWNPEENPPTQEAYLAQLQTEGQQLTAAGVSLYVVLLTSEATLTDPDIATVWKPLWQELAAGRFYEARQAEDLPAIYGRIISSLRPPVTSEQLTVISERWVEDSGEWVVANEPPPTLSPQPSRTPQPTEDDRMTRWPGDKVAEHHLVTPSPP